MMAPRLVLLLWSTASAAASVNRPGSGDGSPTSRFTAVWNCPYMGKQVAGKYPGLDANPSGSFNGSVVFLGYGPKTWVRLPCAGSMELCVSE